MCATDDEHGKTCGCTECTMTRWRAQSPGLYQYHEHADGTICGVRNCTAMTLLDYLNNYTS